MRTLKLERPGLAAVAALAIVMVTYPVVFTVLRAVSKDDIGSAFTAEWLVAAVTSRRGAAQHRHLHRGLVGAGDAARRRAGLPRHSHRHAGRPFRRRAGADADAG